ncbi:CPBP family intramembrane glutamic endopeptidase [Microbulbifer sp. YPW16]|uniref:CPBP family intramembrane glutamic endopeptidase n=1 Tax=Microbulbifer sp. YPW16 TaxID=2904242 RepID=UPI001E3A5C2B|nr:CPBP family intramembrane glutamic endopeptidase [Microbulbifer sp. YPW16]UHQ55421.1 CPBP family intramembrane metalloprotease [Microbulbifer sp. YPW16]
MQYLESPDAARIGLLIRMQVALLLLAGGLTAWSGMPFSWSGNTGYGALFWGALGGVVSYALAMWLTRLSLPIGRSLRRIVSMLRPLLAGITWPQMVVVSLLAGLGEELLFRVLLQEWLAGAFSPALGIVIASLLFALLHAMTPLYFFITLAFGLVLGLAYWLTGSVLLVASWHGVYDLVAIAVITRKPEWLGLPQREASAP